MLNEHLEIINHDKAINLLLTYVSQNTPLNIKTILSFHEIILKSINDEWVGRFRNVPVRISGSQHTTPSPHKLYETMENYIFNMQQLQKNAHPIEYAAVVHAKLANIHPFIDGNGRTCRLIMNMELMKSGYPITLIDVLDKSKYCSLLEHSDIHGNYAPFVDFIAECVKKSLDIYLDAVHNS